MGILRRLKNRKASEPDNIPNELLKYNGQKHNSSKYAIIEILFKKIPTSEIPKEWHFNINNIHF